MTQEEKAKAYDKLLGKAKQIYNKENDVLIMHTLEDLFPELKESEEEKIRKALIKGFNECLDSSSYPKNAQKYWHGIAIEDIFAWLEKQGEQKSAWSEEDEEMIKVFDSIIRYIVEVVDKDALERFGTNREELFSWLKSLRPQPKQEWSEKDENVLEDIEEAIINYWGGDTQDILLDWLKSLKERIGG